MFNFINFWQEHSFNYHLSKQQERQVFMLRVKVTLPVLEKTMLRGGESLPSKLFVWSQ